MKKLFVFLAALAVTILAGAQEKQESRDKMLFNHLSLGVNVGLDGLSAELAVPFTPYFQVRGCFAPSLTTFKTTANLGTFELSGNQINLDNLPLEAKPWNNGVGGLFLDLFPFKDSNVRLIAGAYLGTGQMLAVKADLREALEPSDYKTGIGRNGVMFSTDENGFAYLDVASHPLLPYVGIGSGRAVSLEKRVGFTFDIGVLYTGGVKVLTYDFSDPNSIHTYVVTSEIVEDEDGNKRDFGIIDSVSSSKVLPMLRLGLFVRLF